jgi:GNAT superfamily N-acetyltransferase
VTCHVPVADVGVLVRDDHRRRGLGAILSRHALHVASVLGHSEAVAFGGPENQALRAMLRRLRLEGCTRYTGDLLVTRIALPYPAQVDSVGFPQAARFSTDGDLGPAQASAAR